MSSEKKRMTYEEIQDIFLNALAEYQHRAIELNDLRRAAGVTLSSIHTMMLVEVQFSSEQEQIDQFHTCIGSANSILRCLKGDLDRLGIKGVKMEFEEMDEEPPKETIQ